MKETIYKRIFVMVLDSLGIGAMPDSEKFGDRDVDTFGHILDRMGTLEILFFFKQKTAYEITV